MRGGCQGQGTDREGGQHPHQGGAQINVKNNVLLQLIGKHPDQGGQGQWWLGSLQAGEVILLLKVITSQHSGAAQSGGQVFSLQGRRHPLASEVAIP